jgi:hypothetical protein
MFMNSSRTPDNSARKPHQLFLGAPTLAKFSCLFVITTVLAFPALAQMASGAGGEMQQKLAALKQSTAANQQRLHQYRWIETTQVTYKGEMKPETQKMCSYGPDGKIQKIPMVQPQQQQSGRQGKLKERMVEKKKDELKDYMEQVQSLLTMYVPPNGQRMEQSYQAHNMSIVPGGGAPQLVFKNYAQPGDQMTVTFQPAAKKIQGLNVNTYLDEPKDVVTLTVQFASLPDGTNYPSQTVLGASAKQIQVTTTNSNYQKIVQ